MKHRKPVERTGIAKVVRRTRRSWHARRRAAEQPAREDYTGAFARVRLVRAWIAAASALVAMVSAYVALLERILRR